MCHWGFAGSSTGALVIGFCFDPESAIFQAHLLLVASIGMTWLIFRSFDAETAVLRMPFLPEISFPLVQKG